MSESALLCRMLNAGIWVVVATLLLLLAWGRDRVAAKNASASVRHLIWSAALCALPLIPLLTVYVPARTVVRAIPGPVIASAPATVPSMLDIQRVSPPMQAFPVMRQQLAEVSRTLSPTAPVVQDSRSRHVRTNLARILFVAWVVGVAVVLGQAGFGLIAVFVLRRRSLPGRFSPDSCLDPGLLSERIGLKRRWTLRFSQTNETSAPMTFGVIRPTILLPGDAVSWPDERLEAVLLHELAHIRRFDSATQLLSLMVCALFWFHPGVWLAARVLRAEAETAADDTVLRSGMTPSNYATQLLWFAARSQPSSLNPFATVGVSLMRDTRIKRRILSIIDTTPSRRGVTRGEASLTMITSILLAVGLVAVRPAFSLEAERTPFLSSLAPESFGDSELLSVTVAAPVRLPSVSVRRQATSEPRSVSPAKRSLPSVALSAATASAPRSLPLQDAKPAPPADPSPAAVPAVTPPAAPPIDPRAPEVTPTAPSAPPTTPSARQKFEKMSEKQRAEFQQRMDKMRKEIEIKGKELGKKREEKMRLKQREMEIKFQETDKKLQERSKELHMRLQADNDSRRLKMEQRRKEAEEKRDAARRDQDSRTQRLFPTADLEARVKLEVHRELKSAFKQIDFEQIDFKSIDFDKVRNKVTFQNH
jgi:beta-lactamase regulating signal transducer with metallopeptidase domain